MFPNPIDHPPASQRGGTLLGVAIGLTLGLVLALAAAVYINRASLPFMDRFQPRASGAGAASVPANWNPNQVLRASAASAAQPAPVASAALSAQALHALGQPPSGTVRAEAPNLPTETATWFVQVGAYAGRNEAEAQRARVALLGLEAHLDQHTIGDKTVWRVRLGPFDSNSRAAQTLKALQGGGMAGTLVQQSN